jgi:hypothetical protein
MIQQEPQSNRNKANDKASSIDEDCVMKGFVVSWGHGSHMVAIVDSPHQTQILSTGQMLNGKFGRLKNKRFH